MTNIGTTKIVSEDNYGEECIRDQVFEEDANSRRRPRGEVHVYELDQKVNILNKEDLDNIIKNTKPIMKSNLVVYTGREWLCSRAVQINNPNIDPTWNEHICWFGIGTGGATIGDPFNPTPPINNDTELGNVVPISPSDGSLGDYRTSPETGYYKKQFYSVEFEQDNLNDDSWLISKFTTVITANEANTVEPLSEAGIYIASSDAQGFAGPFTLFARVTFPSITKNNTRQLVFIWYVYF